jgi:hypothetical protein
MLVWDPKTHITKANYPKAAELARQIKTAQKDLENMMGPVIKNAHTTHKSIKSLLNDQLSHYDELETLIKQKFIVFHAKHPELKVDNIAFVDTLEPVVVDESKVPAEYCKTVPDMKKLREGVRANGKLFKCPGVNVVPNTEIRIYADKS